MLLNIDKKDARPLYLQIVIRVKEQIRSGALKPGDELPSVRELAEGLGINMHTVRSAYVKLREQGLLNLRLGRRAAVTPLKKPADRRAAEAEITARLQELVTDALLMGFSPADVRKIMDRRLQDLPE